MSGPSKNTTSYSASDLQRYLKGEMSAPEMHNLEMAALEDPFLADALEGFEKQATDLTQTGDQDLSGHLADLHARLESRVSAPTRKIFPWLRIAAAAILLIGLGIGAWYGLLNKNLAPDEVAQRKVPAATLAPSAKADSTSIAPARVDTTELTLANDKNLVAKAEAHPQTKAETDPRTSLRSHRSDVLPPSPASSTALQPALSSTPSPADSIQLLANSQSNHAVSIKKDTVAYNAETHPLVFSGKVLDVHNNPLPGATLSLASPMGNNPIGAVTDGNGYFSMKVYPKDSVIKVTVGMAGYQQTSLAFNTLNTESSTGNLIHLAEKPAALDEVVVSGYGAKRKETRAMATSPDDEKIDSLWISAKPVMGKQAYLDYLAAGKKNIGADTSIRGVVIISFNVSKKGELTSFKVEQSLTPAHDAGIIHLISEGPPWEKVSKGGSVRTAVRVVF